MIINSILANIRSRTEIKLKFLILNGLKNFLMKNSEKRITFFLFLNGLKIFLTKNIENYFFVFKIYQIANIRYKNNGKSILFDF